jgi:hypothetical protein
VARLPPKSEWLKQYELKQQQAFTARSAKEGRDWGPKGDWAFQTEKSVRQALAAADRDIARVLKRDPGAVRSSYSPEGKAQDWTSPSWQAVLVGTESGIGDPYQDKHVHEAFGQAVEKLNADPFYKGAFVWGWESINPAVHVFRMTPVELKGNPRRNPIQMLGEATTNPRAPKARAKNAAEKALLAERQRLYEQLGYAGNTRDDVRRYGEAIDEINAKLRTIEAEAHQNPAHRNPWEVRSDSGLEGVFADEDDARFYAEEIRGSGARGVAVEPRKRPLHPRLQPQPQARNPPRRTNPEMQSIYLRKEANGWHVRAEYPGGKEMDYGPFATKERGMRMREAIIESDLQRNPSRGNPARRR